MTLQKPLLRLVSLLMSLAIVPAVLADDIEVYGVNSGAGGKPNVLFIIDNSGSMSDATDGQPPSVGEDSKSTILKQVFDEVISNSAGKINAGLMQFNNITSGVKWPVTDLTTLASTIDPDITAGLTGQDVLSSIVQYSSAYEATNYVSPLIEARNYFKGSPVWLNGWDWEEYFIPPVWGVDHYSNNWPQYWTPNKATYLPQDAFKFGNNGPDPLTLGCWNGQPYDSDAYDGCSDKEMVPNSCQYYAESNYTTQECHVPSICISWNGEGDCNGMSQCPIGMSYTATHTEPAHDYCSYYFGSWEIPNYVSPIGSACQKNIIILLSDGLPTDNSQKWKAEEVLANSGVNSCENMGSMFFGDASNSSGDCAPELIENMATTDMLAGMPGSTVKTYTIGFGLIGDNAIKGQKYLKHLANKGGGEFYAADSYESLVRSLNAAIRNISGDADDFSGVSVGVRNSSFSNDNRAFINLFKPSPKRAWPGNMKGYFLGSDGLLDIHGNAVTDPDGSINDDAQSFWSANNDGAIVIEGGLDETISAGSRNLYTYTGSSTPSDIDLTLADHALTSANLALTNTMLGVSDLTARNDLLNWVATAPVSDPLHSKPAIAKYSSGEVVFTMTNQGFIHAVDAANPTIIDDESGGNELYAFIPKELLLNLGQIKTNLSTGSHIYGLDGQITLHHEDDNNDGVINTNEVARLYFGMRRGGNNYYALDISNKNSPRLLWQIKGGEGDFSKMGQSWSRMALTTLKSGSDKKVLIFGGGYDLTEDSKTARSPGIGNRVYIVNAATGGHMWSVGSGATGLNAANMNYSIPSDIAVIDINGNGYTDHLYFGDMGGQLWRVKFKETLGSDGTPMNNFDSNATVEQIGDFGSTANRKFFYPPAVALMSQQGKSYLAITIGSGNRAHPLTESVQDMVFMIRDSLKTPITTTLLLNDLYDSTDNLVGQGTDQASERVLMNAAAGWYMKLVVSEKSLSKLVIYDRKLRFTTYEPTEVIGDTCSANSTSKGRYYVMNLGDATPSSDQIVDESELTKDKRASAISIQGIASEPNIIFPPDGNTVEVFVGKENISTVSEGVNQLYWKQIH